MTDRIEAALAALDKVTPGRWMPSIHQAVETEKPDGTIKTVCICSPIDAILIAAAPDLAAEVVRLRKIIATLSRCANKLEMDGVARMSAEERGKWLDKQVEEIETRDENIAEGYGLERKWFAEAEGE